MIELPDEKPDIATVQDASRLTNPLLASRTADGDKLLIFNASKRVIIYRPATGKIVDILTIHIAAPQPKT